jgi:uncharacterized protein
MRKAVIASVLLLLCLTAASAHAASFNCVKAAAKVEKLICSDAALSKLDEELSAAYKTALQDEKQAGSVRQAQKQWVKERNSCSDVACVKRAYETRLSLVKQLTSVPLASSVSADKTGQTRGSASTALGTACNEEDRSGKSNIQAQDIAGLYRESVEGSPAYVGRPEERRSGYNYLAITPLAGNRLRVRLSTKEINGHDCGFDSEALLCGRIIRLTPNEEELKRLRGLNLPAPYLYITQNDISFASIGHPELYGWQRLYCGNMGSLNHAFKRSTRHSKIDDALFDQ